MPAVSKIKPLIGDPIDQAQLNVLAGAFEGECYLADPTAAPAGTATVAGNVPVATHSYRYTYCVRDPVTDEIILESGQSPGGDVVVSTSAKRVDLTGITASTNPLVNARRVYRGGVLVGTIYDNVTTIFADNADSTSGQPAIPSSNLSGQSLKIGVYAGNTNAIGIDEALASTMRVNSKGALMVGAFNMALPFGFAGTAKIQLVNATPYTVPANTYAFILGISLVVTGSSDTLEINGGAGSYTLVGGLSSGTYWLDLFNAVPLDAGWQIVRTNSATCVMSLIEVPKVAFVVPEHRAVTNASTYTVPANTTMVITGIKTTGSGRVRVTVSGNNLDIGSSASFEGTKSNEVTQPIIVPAGAVIGSSTADAVHFWGYTYSSVA